MPKVKQQTTKENIPYLPDLVSFYKHVQARPPLHKDFDIRQIDPEVLKAYDYVAKPFRHSFYCITLFLQGDITLNTGFWKSTLISRHYISKLPARLCHGLSLSFGSRSILSFSPKILFFNI